MRLKTLDVKINGNRKVQIDARKIEKTPQLKLAEIEDDIIFYLEQLEKACFTMHFLSKKYLH